VLDEISRIIVFPEYHGRVINCGSDGKSEIRFLSEAIPSPIPKFHIIQHKKRKSLGSRLLDSGRSGCERELVYSQMRAAAN